MKALAALAAVALLGAGGCSSGGETTAPTPELCAALNDVFDSIGAAHDGTSADLNVVDDDFRSLTREANRSPGGFDDAAADARASWSEYRALARQRPQPAEPELRKSYDGSIVPLKPLEEACGG